MTESTFPQYPRLVLSKGREKSLLRRHPWVFSGAVSRLEGKANLGETIDIVDHQGKVVSTRRLVTSLPDPRARLDI